MVILNIILLSLGIACASAGYSQFYVTPHFASHISPALPIVHHQPVAAHFTQNSLLDFPSFYHTQPAFFSQNINPFYQQSFSLAAQPQVSAEQARSSSRQESGRSLDSPQSNAPQGLEYGFGYRTQFDDGASSTVVFVSGPDSKRMDLLRSNRLTARKLASDILDAGSNSEKKNEKINDALSENNILGLDFNSLIEAYPDFKVLEHQPGVVHLFSHPANVIPLATPVQASASTEASTETPEPNDAVANDADSESIAIESADNEPSARSDDKTEKEAESIIQETKVLVDEIKNRSASESSSSSTESSSTASSTSTESTSTEETTSKSEETESTTQM